MERPFANTLASRLPKIGGMATMPGRERSLRIALESILPQLDHLYLYFDKHTAVPGEYANHPKITPILPGAASIGGGGKFLGLRARSEPCLYYTVDDDIIYPQDYVAYLGSVLHRHGYRVLAGVHGAVYRHPVKSYASDRKLAHYARGLDLECVVDELGTGTMAFHSSCIELDPLRWAHANMLDLMVTLEAVRQQVPRIAVRRSDGYLLAIDEGQTDSVWSRTKKDDAVQTELILAAFAHYPGCWC